MYDVIILGGGPGGYEAAYLAGKSGFHVAMIEEDQLGGTCLNRGCIPLKSFLYSTKIKNSFEHLVKEGVLEADISGITVNQEKVVRKKDSTVSLLRNGLQYKMTSKNIDIFYGHGVIKNSRGVVEIEIDETNVVIGKKLIIATGSKNRRIDIKDLHTEYQVIDSDKMLELNAIPRELVIIGAGVIGLEAASYFQSAGCSVTLVEQSNQIGGALDSDIANCLKRILAKQGITILTNTKGTDFKRDCVICVSEDKEYRLNPDCALVSIGRIPNLEGIGLENAHVDYDVHGISVNKYCETTNPLIFSCGDVVGRVMLAHVAYRQAQVIVNRLKGKDDFIDYDIIPSVIYTNPEVISVGMTENQCQSRGIQYRARTMPMTYSGRYFAENGRDGTVAKMIVGNKNEVLGFSMVGNYASEVALSAEIIVANRMKLEMLENLIYPHPTVSEIIHELVRQFEEC